MATGKRIEFVSWKLVEYNRSKQIESKKREFHWLATQIASGLKNLRFVPKNLNLSRLFRCEFDRFLIEFTIRQMGQNRC